MLKIWAVITVLVIFTWDVSSAKTQQGSNRSNLNELEGSGSLDPSLHPDDISEHGSGSGDFADNDEFDPSDEDDEETNNHINESVDEFQSTNDHVLGNEVVPEKTRHSNKDIDNRVALASTNNGNGMFASTEMLAAMIAGGTIGLLFAILLILLLVYRMRKKDEGSYDLSKKPIYKKAPTTEFYA
ncbi:syndecan-4 [Hypanus sabinus]|uniref:syndecan-4 n=1 Tax=Hypanus sabinus TaxID=79690 RepID=UPI0028C4C26A|nr:syndecan-4 [Hypanus sabinus]